MRKIKLTKGKYAIVDKDVYEEINKYNWYCSYQGYACRKTPKKDRDKGKPSVIFMHRFILNHDGSEDVDHINNDRLDNRRENLRICERSDNLRNQQKSQNSSSKYKGVCWQRRDKKWQAYIMYNGKNKYLGYFDSEQEAAQAYNESALKYHGEYALLNRL